VATTAPRDGDDWLPATALGVVLSLAALWNFQHELRTLDATLPSLSRSR
jgi:hypothetical protein